MKRFRLTRRSLTAGALVALLPASSLAAESIKIGLLAPLTGNVAAMGTRIRDAAQLYVDQVNAAGGIANRQIELVIEDDRNSPKEAATIAQKLANTPDLVFALGSFSTTASLAAAPILAEAKIPQISPSSSHPDFTRASAYQFRGNIRQDQLAHKHADMVLDKLKARTVVIPYFQDDWGLYTANVTQEAIEKRGGKVLLKEAIAPNSRDFRPLVSKIKELNPEAIFLPVHYQEAGILVQQIRQAGITAPIAAPDPLTNPKFVELAGKAADGVLLYANFFVNDPANKNFVTAYESKFKRLPDQYDALSYDAAGIAISAIKRVAAEGKPISGEVIREALLNGPEYKGLTGTVKYDANREVNTKDVTYIVIRDGKYILSDL